MEALSEQQIHFIGIGGAGMAPLAEICLARGAAVSGSDLVENEKTRHLRRHGAAIAPPGHAAGNLPADAGLAVYSSAVTADNPELALARRRRLRCLRRGEFLGEIGRWYRRPVAISGAHGKTSITAQLSWIVRQVYGDGAGYLIGGALHDASTPASQAGNGDIFVTEVDESDGTHTCFRAAIGIVSNVDSDHAWSVGGVEALHRNFQTFAGRAGRLICLESALTARLFAGHPNRLVLRPERCEQLVAELGLAGKFAGFQAWNAGLALSAALELGIPPETAASALRDFPGVARRMTCHFESGALAVIEDYAHHPVELAASLAWLRQRYPAHHLRILFQPHRFARLQQYFGEFAEVLRRDCDSCLIAPVFAAWTESGPLDSRQLAEAIGGKAQAVSNDWPAVAARLLDEPARPLVIAVIGAGDVDGVLQWLPPGQ